MLALGIAAVAYMGWSVLFSDQGYLVFRQEAKVLAELKAEVEALKDERERLAGKILRLRNDPEALEQLVHEELGYVHGDELMLIMPAEKGEKGNSEKP